MIDFFHGTPGDTAASIIVGTTALLLLASLWRHVREKDKAKRERRAGKRANFENEADRIIQRFVFSNDQVIPYDANLVHLSMDGPGYLCVYPKDPSLGGPMCGRRTPMTYCELRPTFPDVAGNMEVLKGGFSQLDKSKSPPPVDPWSEYHRDCVRRAWGEISEEETLDRWRGKMPKKPEISRDLLPKYLCVEHGGQGKYECHECHLAAFNAVTTFDYNRLSPLERAYWTPERLAEHGYFGWRRIVKCGHAAKDCGCPGTT